MTSCFLSLWTPRVRLTAEWRRSDSGTSWTLAGLERRMLSLKEPRLGMLLTRLHEVPSGYRSTLFRVFQSSIAQLLVQFASMGIYLLVPDLFLNTVGQLHSIDLY